MYTTSGQFVTFLGNSGRREGQFLRPCCITTCANGFIYMYVMEVINEFRFSDQISFLFYCHQRMMCVFWCSIELKSCCEYTRYSA